MGLEMAEICLQMGALPGVGGDTRHIGAIAYTR